MTKSNDFIHGVYRKTKLHYLCKKCTIITEKAEKKLKWCRFRGSGVLTATHREAAVTSNV